MNSNRSYLLEALYRWVIDNDCTPYIVVNTESDAVQVQVEHIEDNRIVLNLSPGAVRDLSIDLQSLSFQGRSAGKPHSICVPIGAVIAIYAKESGEGMVFDFEPPGLTPDASETPDKTSHLRIIK